MADAQLAAVKALAAQAGSGPAARQSLIASGAVPKLLKHLSSKTAAITSQSALALSLLASDPKTRLSVWEHRRALVPALVQTLKTGGPLTLSRSLAALAALIKHIVNAGAEVIKANGVVPILRIAQTGPDGAWDAAITALDAFHVAHVRRMPGPADYHTLAALGRSVDAVEPLIRALSDGPEGARLFALSALRLLPDEPKVLQALRRPEVTELLVGFAGAEDADIVATSLDVLTLALNCQTPGRMGELEVAPEVAGYLASPTLSKLHETLVLCLQSSDAAVVKAASQLVSDIGRAPGLATIPWLRACAQNAPHMLQSSADMVKIQGMHLTIHAWLVGATSDTELCDGPALPLIISALDSRPPPGPRGTLVDLRGCALRTAPGSHLPRSPDSHAADSPLSAIINSRATVAEMAGRVLSNVAGRPWGFQALYQRGFYSLSVELLKEKLLPLGAVSILFSSDPAEVWTPQRLAVARQFLAAGYVEYLFKLIEDGEPSMRQTLRQSLRWATDFVVEYADDPEFPTEEVMKALPCGMHGQVLLSAASLWPSLEAAVKAMLSRVGGFEIFMKVGGVEWATTMISHAPMHATVAALDILSTAVTSRHAEGGHVVLSSSALSVIVGAALLPPAEPVSQEAMRLCVLLTDYPLGYELCRDRGTGGPRVPTLASRASPQSEGSGMGGLGHGGTEAGSKTPQARAESPPHVSPQSEGSGMGGSGHGGNETGFKAPKACAESAPHTSPQSEGSGMGGSGHGGSEAGCEAPTARSELVQSASAAGDTAGSGSNHTRASAGSSSDHARAPGDASVGSGSGGIALGYGGGTVVGSETPDTSAELARHIPADLPPDIPAELALDRPAELAPDIPDELAPDIPAELAPERPAELAPDIHEDLANDIPIELAWLGASRAAIAHFQHLWAPPCGPECNMRSSRVKRAAVVKFLCRISKAEGVLAELRASGVLEPLAASIVSIAEEDPAARVALWGLGGITPLVALLEDSSGADAGLLLPSILSLARNETGRQPAPGVVDDVLAAEGVPVLLRILASNTDSAVSALEFLRLIACEPCGVAAIAAEDCARPLVNALSLSSHPRLADPSGSESPDTRADVVHLIGKVVDERPEQGQALFAAGLAAQLATIFSSSRGMAERDLAMQLVEKLSHHVPGACDALMRGGVLAEVHKLAIAAPPSPDPGCVGDNTGAAELDPLAQRIPEGVSEAETEGVSEAEAARAGALLCRLAGYCSGELEIANANGERIRYTESATCHSQCGTSPLEKPNGVPGRASARVRRASKRVCSLCGVVSEKDLRKCSGCMRARYCSHDCQVAHWKVHKAECRI